MCEVREMRGLHTYSMRHLFQKGDEIYSTTPLQKKKNRPLVYTHTLTFGGFTGNTLAYRVVQFSPDGAVDSLPQNNVPGAVTSLLTTTTTPQANGSPTESPETRLALITSGDVPSNTNSAVVVSGGEWGIL